MGKKQQSRVFDFYALEDRILLSGEGIDGVEVAPDADVAASLMLELAEAEGQATDGSVTATAFNSPTSDSHSAEQGVADTPTFDPALPLEVVFVDSGVVDAETLIDGLRDLGTDSTQWLVVELSAERDGVDQITSTLAELSGVNAIHIVSHGDGQGIQLGGTRLDLDTADGYSSEIASWVDSMDADADLLIYGCDLAGTAEGRALIESIAALTGADVAASDDATGHETLGATGIWNIRSARSTWELHLVLMPGTDGITCCRQQKQCEMSSTRSPTLVTTAR